MHDFTLITIVLV